MHLTYECFNDELNDEQLQHLQKCQLCQQRQQTIQLLKDSADDLNLPALPSDGWEKLSQSLEANDKKLQHKYYGILSFSILCVFSVILYFQINQALLESELRDTIAESQSLEGQIRVISAVVRTSYITNQLWQLDNLLLSEVDMDKRIHLWKKRNQLLRQLIKDSRINQLIFI